MVAITATSYATPSAQSWSIRARLQQARQEADQAETNAQQLRAEADQAEQAAQHGQAKVGALTTQVAQTDSTYAAQLRNQVASTQSKQVQTVLAPVATVAANQFNFPDNPLRRANATVWSLANQGGTSGRFVNLSV
jgi:hypothetical protein